MSRGRWIVLILLFLSPGVLVAQQDEFRVQRPDGSFLVVPVRGDGGFAAVADGVLEEMGWRVEVTVEGLRATRDRDAVLLRPGSPFFRWNGELRQLVSSPYERNGAVWIPLQFFLDFFPERLPELYSVLGPRTLGMGVRAVEAAQRAPGASVGAGEASREMGESGHDLNPDRDEVPAAEDPTWGLVVIDPGHGGRDPGAIGPGGRREKDVALAIGRALARELSKVEGLEVRMTRDRDLLIPLWERGHMATEWKRDRPAVFISIHANSLPDRPSVRGFETYFLSEARTEHEARVAENENAPLALRGEDGSTDEPGLEFILRELRNRDHQRWSSYLAEEIQRGLERVHPGPNRGVKQGPFAVITNALMPAVLVEVGFLTNRNEERVLSRSDFQWEIAREMAAAVTRFFVRYPGSEAAAGNRP